MLRLDIKALRLDVDSHTVEASNCPLCLFYLHVLFCEPGVSDSHHLLCWWNHQSKKAFFNQEVGRRRRCGQKALGGYEPWLMKRAETVKANGGVLNKSLLASEVRNVQTEFSYQSEQSSSFSLTKQSLLSLLSTFLFSLSLSLFINMPKVSTQTTLTMTPWKAATISSWGGRLVVIFKK